MKIGIPKESFKETRTSETRVAGAPESVRKLVKKGFEVVVERDAGLLAGFGDEAYVAEGATIGSAADAFAADIVYKIHRPTDAEVGLLKKGAVLVSFLEPYRRDGLLEKLATAGVHAFGMELIPRTSRAQSMDALSSQANIAGYRAVLEAAAHYPRFFPLMMTSAGSAKPVRVAVLGAGVAGLQAIATARRLGAQVESYDVRAEVKEQILSLGAKFMELDLGGESGAGAGGYARELSEEGKARQQQALTERLKKFDVIVSTANIPGRKSPVLITEDAVRGMRRGSVIIDMAAANGGNCPLTEADRVIVKHGVTLVGLTNYPGLVPADSSAFYGNNLIHLTALFVDKNDSGLVLNLNLEDDIIAGALAVSNGSVRWSAQWK